MRNPIVSFRGITEDLRKLDDPEVNRILDKLIEKRVYEMNLERMKIMFRSQVKILLEKNYPAAANMEKEEFLSHISPLWDKPLWDKLSSDSRITSDDSRFPFIIVIPNEFVPIESQMRMIEYNGRKGRVIKKGIFQNAEGVKTPKVPYLAINPMVDGYTLFRFRTPLFQNEGTEWGDRCLTIAEGIAVVNYYPIDDSSGLKNYGLLLGGSRCQRSNTVPDLRISQKGYPELHCDLDPKEEYEKWGPVSCRKECIC